MEINYSNEKVHKALEFLIKNGLMNEREDSSCLHKHQKWVDGD